jgi:hypothetical protein
MLTDTLKKIRLSVSDPSITILLNTHRTFPDNKQDEIKLRNLVNEAESRLLAAHEKREILPAIEKMKNLADNIDHKSNLDSLALFINQDTAEFLRLSVGVVDRVNIGPNFAVREIVRAINQTESYYILSVSKHKARLFEASNDKLDKEVTNDDFPMVNDTLHPTSQLDKSVAGVEENYIREFFNRVDKAFTALYNTNPLPTLLASDERNHGYYREIADIPAAFVATLNGNHDNDKAHDLVSAAWPVMGEHLALQQGDWLQKLDHAESHQKAISGIQEIYLAARDGRAELLLVERGYLQPAVVSGDFVKIVEDPATEGAVEDVVDEIIEIVMDNGGKVVYLERGKLADYQKLALVARY